MAVYFDHKISASDAKIETVCISWHKRESFLAVGTKDGCVNIYSEDGDKAVDVNIRRVQGYPLQVVWHPIQRIVAIGWSDGCVSIWDERERVVNNSEEVHGGGPVTFVVWTEDGSRVITGDHQGVLAVWRLNNHAIEIITQIKKEGGITQIAFAKNANSISRCYFGGANGIIWVLDDNDLNATTNEKSSDNMLKGITSIESFKSGLNGNGVKVQGVVVALYYYAEKNNLIVLTDENSIYQYRATNQGKLDLISNVKLPVPSDCTIQTTWLGNGMIAIASGDPVIRIWSIDQEECTTLTTTSTTDATSSTTTQRQNNSLNNKIFCVDYNSAKLSLVSGSSEGKIFVWNYVSNSGNNSWELNNTMDLSSPITQVFWGPGTTLIATLHSDSLPTILVETTLNHCISKDLAVFQTAPDRIFAEKLSSSSNGSNNIISGNGITLKASLRIKGLDVNGQNVLEWNGSRVEVYSLPKEQQTFQLLGGFAIQGSPAVLFGQVIIICVGNKVDFCTLRGVPKQSISFLESEGAPTLLSLAENYLAIASKNNSLKVFDLSRREPRQIGTTRKFEQNRDNIGVLESIRMNPNGTRVSIISSLFPDLNSPQDRFFSKFKTPNTKLSVYNVEHDVIAQYDFSESGQVPIDHFWDFSEPRLLACFSKNSNLSAKKEGSNFKTTPLITTFFTTGDQEIMIQDQFSLPSGMTSLAGVQVPYIYMRSQTGGQMTPSTSLSTPLSPTTLQYSPLLKGKIMRDFLGMENQLLDDSTKSAMLNFSYHLTVGNMDEAYKSVKLVQSTNVWQSMAQMCVKTRRLDVLEVCLGNMGNASGARALREAKEQHPLDTTLHLSTVAIHLGLIEEAENFLIEKNRYDLLNNLYQRKGDWNKAIELAETKDRIHLRTTHYNHAKHLELVGERPSAIKEFELSFTNRLEVPRMLLNANGLVELEAYIDSAQDKQLYNWKGKYEESKGQWEKAIKYYSQSGDYLSLVRIRCFQSNFDEAKRIADESGDRQAAYHLARQYESQGDIHEAIKYYGNAACLNHGVRLAIENELDNDVLNLALQSSTPSLMIQAARYFQTRGLYEKAVLLFHKGGMVGAAVEICFTAKLFDHLRTIIEDLENNKVFDKDLISRCGTFFMEHKQFDKAAILYINGGEYDKALDMCMKYGVIITEEMSEKMTPTPKDKSSEDDPARLHLLRRIAQCCETQGSYHLAAKKYTQAKDKLEAMKVLLKSGDTEKIIFFAGVSREKDIYIMAANYLQSLDWKQNPELAKTIIQFYTKAKAQENLATFYTVCAQVEIDDFQNYEKASGAMKEAARQLAKAKNSPEVVSKMESLQKRINLIDQFIQARVIAQSQQESKLPEAAAICRQLLEIPNIDEAVRIGDICAFLVDFNFSKGDVNEAYQIIQRMTREKVNIEIFLDAGLVKDVYARMNIPLNKTIFSSPSENNNDIEEEIQAEPPVLDRKRNNKK